MSALLKVMFCGLMIIKKTTKLILPVQSCRSEEENTFSWFLKKTAKTAKFNSRKICFP